LVRRALREVLEPLGGIERFVQRGQRVLLKPNFIMARRAEEAATTHPAFIMEVARLVREAGGEPLIGDSPALGSARGVASKSGLRQLAEEASMPIVEFTATKSVTVPDSDPPRKVPVARAVLDADVLINLPKFKVHTQMYMTLAVKNLFGCVRGRRKALYHFQRGDRPIEFARLLVDVARVVAPVLTLIDGIVALERHGPSNGDPRTLGLVLAGTDCTALDRIACQLVGADPERLLTLTAAREAGWGETDPLNIETFLAGQPVDAWRSAPAPALADRPFVLPKELTPLVFSPLRLIRGLVRQAWALFRPPARKPAG
jgi:uncharacterized protein (DUF362 family)